MKKITNESLGAVHTHTHTGSLKENKKKNIKGITLVALVVTIIILLILAGISISALTQTGLFGKVKQAKEKQKNAEKLENSALYDYEDKISKYIDGTSRDTENDLISKDIEDFKPKLKEKNGNYITIDASDITVKNSNEIVGYAYLLNGEVKGYTKESQYVYENLEKNHKYIIKVIAMDKYGKIKISKEIEETTIDKVYLYNDGIEYSSFGGEWKVSNYGEPNHGTFSKESNYLLITGNYCYTGNFMVMKEKTMDFTGYSKIYAKVEVTGVSSSHENRNTGIGLKANNGTDIGFSKRIRQSAVDNLNQGIETITIDLNGLTNTETYLIFDSNSYILKVYEIWLE